MDGGSGGRKPVWMTENTSYESKYAPSDSDEGHFQENNTNIVENDTSASDSEDDAIDIEQQIGTPMPMNHSQTHDDNVHKHRNSVHAIDTAVVSWILESMTGHNVVDLLQIIFPYKDIPGEEAVYREFSELHQILQQLNFELLNMFDNYLCFAGSNDEEQMKVFSKLACSRAVANIKTKCHTNASVTEKLALQACEKLNKFYMEENQKISKMEEKIADETTRQILNAYQEKIAIYLDQDAQQADIVHKKLKKHLVKMMDHCLDFSVKMNNVHTEATASLEASINKKFSQLKSKHNAVRVPPPVPTRVKQDPAKPVPTPRVKSIPNQNPSANKIQLAQLEYRKIIDPQWKLTQDHKTLHILHENALIKVAGNLTPDERVIVTVATRYYFGYISELYEESRGNSAAGAKRLCINFTNDGIKFGLYVNQTGRVAGENWNFDPATLSASTTWKQRGNVAFLDSLADFLLIPASPSQKFKERNKLIDTIKTIKQEGEVVAGVLDNVLMIIPTWLGLDHLTTLRNLSHEAYFKQASFIRESSLAAYSLLDTPNMGNRSIVVITVGDTGVHIEIFSKDNLKAMKLLAVAVYKWELVVEPEQEKDTGCFSCFKVKTTPTKSPRKSMSTQENPVGILCTTYDAAVTQLNEDKENLEKKLCFLMPTEAFRWEEGYKTFLRKRTDQVTDIGSSAPIKNFGLKSTIAFSKEPSKLRSIIVDHPIPSAEPVETSKSKPPPVPAAPKKKSSTRKPDLAAATSNSQQDVEEKEKVAGKRAKLLEKCNKMREQQSTGQVRLGVLFSKLVNEAIEKAETVGNDNTAPLSVIMEHHAKLNEISKQHNFDIII